MIRWIILAALATVAFGGSSRFLPDTRIVGGSDTTIEKHPWQCSLEYYRVYYCGCTLIAWNRCLTTASCTDSIDASIMTVRCGTTIVEEGGVVVKVLNYNQNPNFGSITKQNDLSILHLEVAVSPSRQIGLVRLAKTTDEYSQNYPVTCTGWGTLKPAGDISKILQAVNLNLVNHQDCVAAYSDTMHDVDNSMICAAGPEKDFCYFDKGGPLILHKTLIGIISWSNGCARDGYPGVYASIASMRSWIDSDLAA